MGHDVSQGGSENKAAKIDHACPLADNGKHFIGDPFRQSGLGEHHADDDGPKDKENRRVHEVLERHLGRADKKKRLHHSDSQTGDADRHNLKHPPGCGQQKKGNGPLALHAQQKMFSLRINRIRP